MLIIQIQDVDILNKLNYYATDSGNQEATALFAMRLGLEAMAVIRGEMDKQALHQVGKTILEQMHETVITALDEHRQALLEQFSMDMPDSAMQKLSTKIEQSYTQVHDEVTKLSERRIYQRRSTQGGGIFEEDLGDVLQFFAQSSKDIFEPTGNKIGKKDKCKVGDYVVTLGETCHAPGENIVIEAKRDNSYTLSRILNECTIARVNRDAQVCLFVWDKDSCGGKHAPLQRYANDIVVLWDPTDDKTDIYVEAAFWLARSLTIPKKGVTNTSQVHFNLLHDAFDKIVQQADALEKVKLSAQRVINEGNAILSSSSGIHAILQANIDSMRLQVTALSQITY